MTSAAAVDVSKTGHSFSGFGSRKEQELYDHIVFNSLRLLSMRTSKLLSQVQLGNYNPYSKHEAHEDDKLKQAIEKFYLKMAKMEKRKYMGPFFSEALTEIASLVGVLRPKGQDDALSAT